MSEGRETPFDMTKTSAMKKPKLDRNVRLRSIERLAKTNPAQVALVSMSESERASLFESDDVEQLPESLV